MFTNFQPEQQEKKLQYFDDVKASDGWEGHTTTKTIERLTQEIQNNLALIGCIYVGCQRGKFGDRYGFQIHQTLGALWMNSGNLTPLLPASTEKFEVVEGEVI